MNAPFIFGKNIPTMNSSKFSHISTPWCRLSKVGALTVALASIAMPAARALVLDTGTLSIAPTGVLDLQNNDLVVRIATYGTVTVGVPQTPGSGGQWVYNGVMRYAQTGSNFLGFAGYFNGPGINSSVAATLGNTAIGVIDNSQAGYGMWPVDGLAGLIRTGYTGTGNPIAGAVTLTGAEILSKYTYFGDADLNGIVDPDSDYNQFLLGLNNTIFNGGGDAIGLINQTNVGWLYGDFDYSGFVDPDVDYQQFLLGLNEPAVLASQGGSLGVTAVPEPSSMVLFAFGFLGIASRRVRKDRFS